MITFKVRCGRDKRWYWYAESRNGTTVADGGEGYATRSNAIRAVRRFCATVTAGRWRSMP